MSGLEAPGEIVRFLTGEIENFLRFTDIAMGRSAHRVDEAGCWSSGPKEVLPNVSVGSRKGANFAM